MYIVSGASVGRVDVPDMTPDDRKSMPAVARVRSSGRVSVVRVRVGDTGRYDGRAVLPPWRSTNAAATADEGQDEHKDGLEC
ncbi:Hypothetical protein NTJ_02730 [Nesidiocoris tenuis]|uniref:Uncharacterized protein n=1 Tax=Nesidiocoris tenuis TaxID=355587 RepID=A0ABN7ACA5_9HEMI|nr:Hypothetical protein NTJ_02730 [Nesidiocoris tenuis]